MRVLDQPVPAIDAGDRPGPDVPMGQWPAQLFVAIESIAFGSPQWDASPAELWDDPDGPTWDQLGGELVEYVDAICWLHGLSIDTGEPDDEGRFTATELTMSLDNRDGRWSRYSASGQLVVYPPGRRVLVWAVLDGEPWWLFAGKVAEWNDVGARVELTAFDALSDLNLRIGEWNPGVAGESPAARFAAILALIGYGGPARADAGDIGCIKRTTSNSPLEELQAVAESDGGALLVDADGTLLYRDRRWVGGRADQTSRPVLSSNVCDVDAVVWDLELSTDDDTIANLVVLANVPAPTSTQVTSRDVVSEDRFGTYTLPQNRDEDLWDDPTDGQALADYLVELRKDPTSRIRSSVLYLTDPVQDLWRVGIDLRRGDVLELVEDVRAVDGSTARLDVFVIASRIRHDITPTSWVLTLGTSRTVGNRLVTTWDESPYTWDDPSPQNVWSH